MKRITAIVEQHAEDAAFLWLLRDRSVSARHSTLSDLAKLDHRVEAHIDGLRVADDSGWEVCREALAHREPGEVFAASILAFESRHSDRIDSVLDVAGGERALLRAIVSALGWMASDTAEPLIRQLVASESPTLCRIGIAAAAAHRIVPGKVLETSLADGADPLLTARTVRAAGELGLVELLPLIRPHLDGPIDEVRFAAAWSAALLGDRSAVPVLGAFAGEGGPYVARACAVGLRRLPSPVAFKAHQELAGRPELSRLAVAAVGMIGNPALVDWLLVQMRTPALARLAGEAFATITGIDIATHHFEGMRPDGFESGPTDDKEDENVALDPDDDLPWPNRENLQDWWFDYRSEFRTGTRYLLGNPVEEEWLWDVLRNGRQRQRAAAALELVLQTPRPLFEVRAPGFRQQEILRPR